MRPSRLASLRLLLFGALTSGNLGCRAPEDEGSLVGVWEGMLSCATEVEDQGQQVPLSFAVDLHLDLQEEEGRSYEGLLDTRSVYDWYGSRIEETARYDVRVLHAQQGRQQAVTVEQARCLEAEQNADGDSVASGCEAVQPVPPAGSLRWDGADTLTVRGAGCTGEIVR